MTPKARDIWARIAVSTALFALAAVTLIGFPGELTRLQETQLPPTSIAGAVPGRVHLQGAVRATDGDVAPGCVATHREDERRRPSGKTTVWVTEREETQAVGFTLADATGELSVPRLNDASALRVVSQTREGQHQTTLRCLAEGDHVEVFGVLTDDGLTLDTSLSVPAVVLSGAFEGRTGAAAERGPGDLPVTMFLLLIGLVPLLPLLGVRRVRHHALALTVWATTLLVALSAYWHFAVVGPELDRFAEHRAQAETALEGNEDRAVDAQEVQRSLSRDAAYVHALSATPLGRLWSTLSSRRAIPAALLTLDEASAPVGSHLRLPPGLVTVVTLILGFVAVRRSGYERYLDRVPPLSAGDRRRGVFAVSGVLSAPDDDNADTPSVPRVAQWIRTFVSASGHGRMIQSETSPGTRAVLRTDLGEVRVNTQHARVEGARRHVARGPQAHVATDYVESGAEVHIIGEVFPLVGEEGVTVQRSADQELLITEGRHRHLTWIPDGMFWMSLTCSAATLEGLKLAQIRHGIHPALPEYAIVAVLAAYALTVVGFAVDRRMRPRPGRPYTLD